jgi:transposase-like protein
MASASEPKTLRDAILWFADYENCRKAVEEIRWPDGTVKCPTCGSARVAYLFKQRRYKCYEKHPCQQFSLKVGTVFEDSPIGLEKWLPALWLLTNCKNGISSYELGRALGVTQKTGWFMLHRLRFALHGGEGSDRKFSGHVEADETFIGGKARNMHKTKRERLGISQSRSMVGKTAVMGLLERHGEKGSQVRTHVIQTRKKHQLEASVMEHVEVGSNLYTDSLKSYDRMGQRGYIHGVIDHAEKYVDGAIHTNGLENFGSGLVSNC